MPFDGIDGDPVVRVLTSAKDIIRARGLQKHSYGLIGGPRCPVGAIWEAGVGAVEVDEVVRLARQCYGHAVGEAQVEEWADDDRRTLEEVLAGFDLAVEWRLQAIIPTR